MAGLQSDVHIKHASVAAVLLVTELRGGGAVEGAQIGDFGLLSNGCRLSAASKWTRLNRFGVDFNDFVMSDGYYFTTSAGPADNDPVRWVVLVTSVLNATADSTWVGASGWEGLWGFQPNYRYRTPVARNHSIIVDGSAFTENLIYLLFSCSYIGPFVGIVTAVIAARLGHLHLPRRLIGSSAGFLLAVQLVATALSFSGGNFYAAASALLSVPGLCVSDFCGARVGRVHN